MKLFSEPTDINFPVKGGVAHFSIDPAGPYPCRFVCAPLSLLPHKATGLRTAQLSFFRLEAVSAQTRLLASVKRGL